jgi:hypothetical protein
VKAAADRPWLAILRKWIWVVVFAAAFVYVESAVVV